MNDTASTPLPRYELAGDLDICRVVTGLWQVADMERDGHSLDLDTAARAMVDYARDGFDTFDMADHYGSAEDISGRFLHLWQRDRGTNAAARIFTKWCPPPGPMTADVVEAAVRRSMARLGAARIDLLQFHWWSFEYPQYIDALRGLTQLREAGLIAHLGVTNFDTDHLRVLVKHGIPVVSNQVSFSVLDRRAAEDMTDFCLAHGIKLLAYGTLAGGFLSERWLGLPEPEPSDRADWSKMKYKRFIDSIGGWSVFQSVLHTLANIARKHGVSIANVCSRWCLDQPAVAAVIVGARLSEREHRGDNRRIFGFQFDDDDRARLRGAFSQTRRIGGDCGDEYRRAPFLTASGDLSHHLASLPPVFKAVPIEGRPNRLRIDSGSQWEPVCGYSRAVRIGDRILVSGTTATHGEGEVICPGDVAGQTVYILDKIIASVASLGGSREDIVRTRIYLKDAARWEEAARVHGRVFGAVRPADTLVEIAGLIGPYEVEIEAEAIVGG